MSYILEALKKSDRERKQGKVPDLGTVQDPADRRRRRSQPLWPYVLLVLLALGGLLLGGWLIWRESPPAPAPTGETAAPAQTPQVAALPAAEVATPTTLPGGADRPPADSANSAQPSPAPEPSPSKAAAATPAEPPLPAAIPLATPAELAPAPEVEPVTDSSPPEEAPPADEQEQTSTPEVIADSKVVKLENLPVELKQELPEIKIGVHLYSDTPEARRASINGRLLREGQQVGPGLRLEEITRRGAVLSFRGRKFSVAVFPR